MDLKGLIFQKATTKIWGFVPYISFAKIFFHIMMTEIGSSQVYDIGGNNNGMCNHNFGSNGNNNSYSGNCYRLEDFTRLGYS